jgi:uracil-DNA glycosylase
MVLIPGKVDNQFLTRPFLVRALFETGFANKPISISRDDGLILKDAYLTAAIRCAPPLNKPAQSEISNCSRYLLGQTRILKRILLYILFPI